MAYSSVRVQFEIGHEASVRTKKTPDGFTHDWEVFVKGADNTDIQYFVDKVVFHLHETFPKPRRVIKEPPYVVKESGYAGFVLPIDVYLKNKEEPKKISFQYDLTLQNSGPPISRVLREPRVFQNPSEDFRRKLIRGGGVGVDTPNEIPAEDHKPSSSLGLTKSKPTESPSRKQKLELKLNDSFAELFGTPIRRITPEPKKISDLNRKLPELEKKKSVKLHKDDKEFSREKDKYVDKDRLKERDKSKEKPPKLSQPPPVVKPKEEHKKHEEKDRKKEDYDEKKKRKEERDRKEKHKEGKDAEKVEKEVRKEKKEQRDNDYFKKLNSSKSHENRVPSDKNSSDIMEKERERSEKEKHKHRHKKKEKEKTREKEKHKKEKEKNDRDSKERNREKEKFTKKRHEEVAKEREDKIRKKSRTPSPGPGPEKMKKGPLNALLVELGSSDSASPLSEDEDSIPSFKLSTKTPAKIVPENKIQTSVNMGPKMTSTIANSSAERTEKDAEKHLKIDEVLKNKREKSPGKKNKKSDGDAEKRRAKEHKRRSTSSDREKEEEDVEKPRREEAEAFEKEQAEKEEEKIKSSKKERDLNRKRKRDKASEQSAKSRKDAENESNAVAASQSSTAASDPTEAAPPPEETRKPDKFTKEYVAQLRDLQHRIMTLEDNDDLQKVVEVIAETGQYEITKKTFDFDLCALDSDTIKRLQQFFSPT